MIVFFIVFATAAVFFKEKSNWIFILPAMIASLLSPRFKKVKMQSGNKLIITNDLFNLFNKED